MSRWILLLLLMGVGWSGGWLLYLGAAEAHSGLNVADYGPLLIFGLVLLFGATKLYAWLLYGTRKSRD